jgi:hypothetical protein
MMQGFGIDERELYRTWIAYVHGLAHKVNAAEVIRVMRESKQIDPKALDYFTVMGMNLFLESVAQEVARRDCACKPE